MAQVVQTSKDFGATCYLIDVWNVGLMPDIAALEADGRVRDTFNPSDWSTGDYTYAEDTQALYLTGTGEMLWQVR